VTKPRPRRARSEAEIDEVSWRFLCDACTPEDYKDWLTLTLEYDEKEFAVVEPPTGKRTSELWAEFGGDVVAWWIKDRPGTRPWCWWKYSAPEPRKRVGGVGTVDGNPEYLPDFRLPRADAFVAVDPSDPPSFESQAAYLKRLKVLLPGEEKRLTRHDFAPEAIEPKPPHSRGVGFHSRFERPLSK
jgi:hypothetical protein